MTEYPPENLSEDEDDGTIVQNVETLASQVVGQRIVNVERKPVPKAYYGYGPMQTVITLDSGKKVHLVDTEDCCAGTALEAFMLHVNRVDHIITGVGTTNGYQTWHIYADMGDVLELTVDWSAGNQFYYGYGFDIQVEDCE